MKPKKIRYGLGLLIAGLFVVGLASCDYSYFEIDELPDYQYSPVFAFPLVNSSLTISDFVPDDDEDLIEVGDDQLISLVYSDRLVSTTGALLYSLPNAQYPANFSASPPGKNTLQTFTRTFAFETGHADELDSLGFGQGVFSLQVSAPGLAADGYQATITLTIPGSYNQSGQPFSMEVNANGTAEKSMIGYTIPFYSSGTQHNQFDVHYQVEFSGQGNPANAPYTFNISQQWVGLQLEKMFGTLATRILNIGGMGIDIGIFSSDFEGEIVFEDPRLRLMAANSFGFPINVTASDLYLEHDDQSVEIIGFPSPWTIQAPGINQMGQPLVTSFVLNRANSNIFDGVEIYPETVYSSFLSELNPGQEKGFVLEDSRLDVLVELELPLYGIASGFSLKDTIEFSRNDSITEIEWIELVVDVVNGLPLDLFLQLGFADEDYTVQVELFEGVDDFNLVAAAQVDGSGNVISPERKNTKIYLNEQQSIAFLNSPNLILSARVLTANQAQTSVKVYDYQTLDVRIGARVKAKVLIEF
ncbi:MAG: hypothetical protein K0B09_00825 [Bacteroidales bacterium]|nr:hypothetical protein [Bacteroidales bacterium]